LLLTSMHSHMKARQPIPAHLKLRLLATTEVFCDLSPDEMERLHRLMSMVSLPRGRTLWRPGDRLEALYVLKWGRVQMYRLGSDGRKFVTATLPRGTVFGELVFTEGGVAETYCEAVEDSLVCIISRSDLPHVVRRFPCVALRLIEVLSRRIGEMEARLEETALMPARARLAASLLKMCREWGPELRVTHRQLAEAIGCHRETVSRILGQMRSAGLISYSRGSLRIVDVERLRAWSGQG